MNKIEKIIPVFDKEFYHDGRGPILKKVIWGHNGVILKGFEFINPNEDILRHLLLKRIEAFSFAGEEVHVNILASVQNNAAIFKIENSNWKKSFNQRYLSNCNHFQIVFYDEIYDVICENIIFGLGQIIHSQNNRLKKEK